VSRGPRSGEPHNERSGLAGGKAQRGWSYIMKKNITLSSVEIRRLTMAQEKKKKCPLISQCIGFERKERLE